MDRSPFSTAPNTQHRHTKTYACFSIDRSNLQQVSKRHGGSEQGVSGAVPGGGDERGGGEHAGRGPGRGRGDDGVRPDAADPVRAGHRGERGAHRGVLREAQGAPGQLLLPVQEEPQHAALRQLPQRQEGLRRLQGAPAQVLNQVHAARVVPSLFLVDVDLDLSRARTHSRVWYLCILG